MSLPSRECGLKSTESLLFIDIAQVTPFAGVWIEIELDHPVLTHKSVTPFAGVWIEILTQDMATTQCAVTPFAGVWIEI